MTAKTTKENEGSNNPEPEFKFPGQTNFYSGKVRDVYTIGNRLLLMIASDRISAFDVILPREIPYKGQILNQIAAEMLKKSEDICPNWFFNSPAPNASIGLKMKPFQIEMVVRGNLVGSAWRLYEKGERMICGVPMPDGMKENDFFPEPILTPTTKAEQGHDLNISEAEIISSGLASKKEWKILKRYALDLFNWGVEYAEEKGLILVDTKYEFGKFGDEIYLIDEVHTPDSSRYFYQDSFAKNPKKPKQLSKEFVREWLMENGFDGKEGQIIPEMTDEKVNEITDRYIELYEIIMGQKFVPKNFTQEEIYNLCVLFLKES